MRTASIRSLLITLLVAWIPAVGAGQPLPAIDLEPAIECWYHSDFPMLTALVDPSDEIVNSRLYFRCSLYQDYYFVDLEHDGAGFSAVAPQAEETCPRVHYYVEAVTRDFTSARTPERVAEVTSHTECRRNNPAAAFFPGDDPQIVLGSTSAGAPPSAPGFKTLGVGAYVSATGAITAATGAGSAGGSSAAVIAGVAAAGGGAAGVGVLVAGSSSDTTTTTPALTVLPPVAPAPPPPAVTTTPPAPPTQPVKACVRFEPIDAIVDVNEPLKIDARCSEGGPSLTYRVELGDGRVKEGSFLTVVYSKPGTYQLTLTVIQPDATVRSNASSRLVEEDSITRTVRVRQYLVADFDVYNVEIDSCNAVLKASMSQGDIVAYRWELDVRNAFGEGVVRESGRIVRHQWGSGCFRAQGNTRVRLTVEGPGGGTASVAKDVNVFRRRNLETTSSGTVETALMTHLDASERVSAQIVVNGGRTLPVSPGVPASHRFPGSVGRNSVEAVLIGSLDGPAMWRFDFSQAAHFVPGSLRLVRGTEVSRAGRSVIVRLEGRAGERIRIEYELAR